MSFYLEKTESRITDETLKQSLIEFLKGKNLKRVLLLPPDMTRLHSYAGKITALLYDMLHHTCKVDILPALGTHDAMTKEECATFFGEQVPYEVVIPHRWKTDIQKIGTVPADYIRDISGGLLDEPIEIEINRRLLDPTYDLILSIGQVIPHEVVGMANYSKNVFVGCGGQTAINKSHFLGAVYGLEKLMGKDHSPVRKVFDYAEQHFIKDLPLQYILTVTTVKDEDVRLEGLYMGRERSLFEKAVALSQRRNFKLLDKSPRKMVVYLDEREFKSTWLGNKSIYRTRMAIADDGDLIILAPGVRKFGEDLEIDQLLRKYGYVGREKILQLFKENEDLRANPSAAAHLIHGSSDGRFRITYAVNHLSQEEIEQAGYTYASLADVQNKYNPAQLKQGYNQMPDGEEIYFIGNPAIGLWASRDRILEE